MGGCSSVTLMMHWDIVGWCETVLIMHWDIVGRCGTVLIMHWYSVGLVWKGANNGLGYCGSGVGGCSSVTLIMSWDRHLDCRPLRRYEQLLRAGDNCRTLVSAHRSVIVTAVAEERL